MTKPCIYFHTEKVTKTLTIQTCRNTDSYSYGNNFCFPDNCKDYEEEDE